jgi:mono/diheme cytochrome c family protein
MRNRPLWIKAIALVFAVAVLGIATALIYYRFVLPHKAAAVDRKMEVSTERIARGKYLFDAVSACGDCHSGRDLTRVGGPFLPDAAGEGMELPFGGLPGRIVATNITPEAFTGIGSWSDGEKIRALREGISRDGHPLFPIMPYTNYRFMSDQDAESVVAYLDNLPPIKNALPVTKVTFPVSLLIRAIPQPAGHIETPAKADTLRYGQYLATLGYCLECHTQDDRGKLRADQKFAGGKAFDSPIGRVISANISPDRATGIGNWTEDMFVERFKAYQRTADSLPPKATAGTFTVMPWLSFSQMEESDLRAIFKYLKTQLPVVNKVNTHPTQAADGGPS